MVYLAEYSIWSVLWEKVYGSKIADVNKLKTSVSLASCWLEPSHMTWVLVGWMSVRGLITPCCLNNTTRRPRRRIWFGFLSNYLVNWGLRWKRLSLLSSS